MANPKIVELTANTWELVAENVTGGNIKRVDTRPNVYLETYRTTGGTAPISQSEGSPIFINDNFVKIDETDTGIDVYIMAVGKNGSVRVDI